jgi:hypothetical protein
MTNANQSLANSARLKQRYQFKKLGGTGLGYGRLNCGVAHHSLSSCLEFCTRG